MRYDYKCTCCGNVFEVQHNANFKGEIKCECGCKAERKIPKGQSFILKGTGWYKTDYAGGKK